MSGFLRRPFRVRRHMPSALLPIALMVLLSVLFFTRLSLRLAPLVETMAVSRAVNAISAAVSEAADECMSSEQMTYRDFVDIEVDEQGHVTALSFRIIQSGAFKHNMIERLTDRLESIETETLSIPMGNLTDVLFLSALGPDIRVSVRSVGDVAAEYENEFISAGVNQTRHAIYLNVTVTVFLMIPGEVIPVTSEKRVCVAETVIVGDVPDTYMNLQDGVGQNGYNDKN